MAKAFASQGDKTEKKITFEEVGPGLWAFTAEGDPNSGVIIGDDSVMIVEAQATPQRVDEESGAGGTPVWTRPSRSGWTRMAATDASAVWLEEARA